MTFNIKAENRVLFEQLIKEIAQENDVSINNSKIIFETNPNQQGCLIAYVQEEFKKDLSVIQLTKLNSMECSQ